MGVFPKKNFSFEWVSKLIDTGDERITSVLLMINEP